MRNFHWLYSSLAFVMLASVDEPSCGGSGSTGDVTPTVNITNNNCNNNGGTGDCSNSTVNQGAGGEEDLSKVPPLVSSTGRKAYAVRQVVDFSNASSAESQGNDPDNPIATFLTASEFRRLSRGVAFDGQYEYFWDEMTQEEANSLVSQRGVVADDTEITTPDLGPGLDPSSQEMVLGNTDGRRNERRNTSYPWSAIIWISGCTASLIGPSTAVTAAHCVYDALAKKWRRGFYWSPGRDGFDAQQYPWQPGSSTYPSPNGTKPVYLCYWVSIPQAYLEGSDKVEWDYAVIEFRTTAAGCNNRPGDQTGWLGLWMLKDSSLEGATAELYGYPGDKTSGTLWGMSGIMQEVGQKIHYTLDTFGGQSGAPIMLDRRRLIGVHSGSRTTGLGSTVNRGVRIDRTVVDFIYAHSKLGVP